MLCRAASGIGGQKSRWRDGKGLAFIGVAAQPYWDHMVDLVTDSYNLGFDEMNFDYVQYPSDGNMTDISFVLSNQSEYGRDKQANLEAFFKYLNEKIDEPERYTAVRHVHTGRAVKIHCTPQLICLV